jgi:large subunit ribosomal protein LP2
MKAAGISVDKESLKAFFKQMEGKNIPDLVAEGKKKQVEMPRGGGGGGAAASSGGAAAAAPKEEEKKEEVEEVDMGGLFGDDDDY